MERNLIDATIRRTRRYWYIDGLVELRAGILGLVSGALFFVWGQVGSHSPAGLLLAFVPLLITLAVLGSQPPFRRAQERITYPRTGWAEPPRPSRQALLSGAVAGVLVVAVPCACAAALLIGFFVARLQPGGDAAIAAVSSGLRGVVTVTAHLLPVLGALVFATCFAYMGGRYKLPRFYLLGGFDLLVGGLALIRAWSQGLSMATDMDAVFGSFGGVFFLVGTGLLVSGVLTLRAYLRDYPRPVAEPS